MRRFAIAALAASELFVGCAIFSCSLELAHAAVQNAAVGRVAHAVVRSTQRLASVEFRISLRRRA